jgi:hypothetical protein
MTAGRQNSLFAYIKSLTTKAHTHRLWLFIKGYLKTSHLPAEFNFLYPERPTERLEILTITTT